MTLVYLPGDDRAMADDGDLIVADPAGYAAIKVEFMALGQTGYLAGLSPCPVTEAKGTAFAVINPQGQSSVAFFLEPPEQADQAFLEGGPAPEPGPHIGTILVVNQPDLSCAG